jgi:hypothetical protein
MTTRFRPMKKEERLRPSAVRREIKANEAFINSCHEGPLQDGCVHCKGLEDTLRVFDSEASDSEFIDNAPDTSFPGME